MVHGRIDAVLEKEVMDTGLKEEEEELRMVDSNPLGRDGLQSEGCDI